MYVKSIKPEKKDIDRAQNFRNSGKRHDTDTPFITKAEPMAKAITDREKLVRRAKAVVAVWGIRDIVGEREDRTIRVNVWKPFMNRLVELGFDTHDIYDIMMYEHDSPLQVLGLDDLFEI